MTPGAMRDVEADEVFVVLAGAATVEFDRPGAAADRAAPGSVVRLEAGMRTVWTVRETLRKVYVAPWLPGLRADGHHGRHDDGRPTSKPLRDEIRLVEGHGVDGGAHAARRYGGARASGHLDGAEPRQVRLLQRQLLGELAWSREVAPSELGDNVTTSGLDLLALPAAHPPRRAAEVELTGLQNPAYRSISSSPASCGRLIRRDTAGTHGRAGSMALVVEGGMIVPATDRR